MTSTRPGVSGWQVAGFTVLCLLAGVVMLVGTVFTSLMVCGISGCSGGGFGVSVSPVITWSFAAATGGLAAGMLLTAVVAVKPRMSPGRLAAGALGLALVLSLVVLTLAGADLRGCPTSGPQAHCAGAARR
jgi:hypothetical protein